MTCSVCAKHGPYEYGRLCSHCNAPMVICVECVGRLPALVRTVIQGQVVEAAHAGVCGRRTT